VVKELRPKDSKAFEFPTHISACGGDGSIERIPGQVAWRCVSNNSFEQIKRKFYYFVSKKCFNIDGMGPRIIDVLLEKGLITNFDDIFTLKKGDLLILPRFAEKSVDNLLEAINKSKEINLSKFIASLSISQVGEETSYDIVNHFTTLEKIQNAKYEEIESIHGVGPIVAKSLFDWFNDNENKKLIKNLLKYIKIVSDQPKDNKFKGLSFVFTGSIKMDRNEAQSIVRNLGGEVSNSVSKKTSFVIAGENAGSKLDKANELGIKVISEDDFIKMYS
jgi:DNA ligase (NAD+)